MSSAIQAVGGILLILAVGGSIDRLYRAVQTETVRKVHAGLSTSLESYTRKLTGTGRSARKTGKAGGSAQLRENSGVESLPINP